MSSQRDIKPEAGDRVRCGVILCRLFVEGKRCTLMHGHTGICRSDWYGSGILLAGDVLGGPLAGPGR